MGRLQIRAAVGLATKLSLWACPLCSMPQECTNPAIVKACLHRAHCRAFLAESSREVAELDNRFHGLQRLLRADREPHYDDSMSTIRTRIATLADLGVIAPLFDAYRQFYEQAPDLALAKSFIRDRLQNNESVVLLALDEAQQAVGFCQLYPTFCSVVAKPIYSLYDLFVSPEARRSGAGRVLLQAAERLAAERGKARMDLTTARTNKPAQAAYESLGWVRDEIFYAYSRLVPSGG